MLPHSDQAKYIAVIRDPKDVFVSNYHFIRDGVYGPAMPEIETWLELFLSPDFVLGGSWAVNAAGYWAERHRPNVLITSFREMKRDLRGTVKNVARFLNIDVGEDVIDEVCRRSSFEYMKAANRKFAMGKMVAWRKPGVMIRKGSQGGSSELLTPAQQRRIDEHFIAELARLGSDFPYAQFCELAVARS
jgi:aryl sulfotransferase